MASLFVGFSPVNNPAITIAVILDSPVGLHQGGQVTAPVLSAAQQVLEYLHVPHDVDVKDPKRLLLQAKAKDRVISNDSSPMIRGEPLDFNEDAKADTPVPAVAKTEAPRSSAVKAGQPEHGRGARYECAGGCFGRACESGWCITSERHSDSRRQRWRGCAVVPGEIDAVGDRGGADCGNRSRCVRERSGARAVSGARNPLPAGRRVAAAEATARGGGGVDAAAAASTTAAESAAAATATAAAAAAACTAWICFRGDEG